MSVAWVGAGIAAVGVISGSKNASKAADAQSQATAGQMAIAQQQQDLAQEQWDRYKTMYAPLEDKIVNNAQEIGSSANQNKAAADAAATSAASFAGARARLNKNPGVNPSSQQYQQIDSQLGLAEAASGAAAQTGAREGVRARGDAAQLNAVAMGKGLPASATAAGAYGANAYGAASSAYGAQASSDNSGIGQFAKGASGIIGSAGVKDWLNSPSRSWNTSSNSGSSNTPVVVDTNDSGVFST